MSEFFTNKGVVIKDGKTMVVPEKNIWEALAKDGTIDEDTLRQILGPGHHGFNLVVPAKKGE